MNLTSEIADIASVKIEEIKIKQKSIEEEIKKHIISGNNSFKLISIHQLPKSFQGFIWKLKGKTMIAIRGDNMSFQIVVLKATVPTYITNMQAIRKFNITPKILQGRIEESIRLTKTINNTESKITLDAKIIT